MLELRKALREAFAESAVVVAALVWCGVGALGPVVGLLRRALSVGVAIAARRLGLLRRLCAAAILLIAAVLLVLLVLLAVLLRVGAVLLLFVPPALLAGTWLLRCIPLPQAGIILLTEASWEGLLTRRQANGNLVFAAVANDGELRRFPGFAVLDQRD